MEDIWTRLCRFTRLLERDLPKTIPKQYLRADLDLHTLTSADLHHHTLTPADLDLHTLTPADLDLHTFTSADLLSLFFYSLLRRGRCRRSATKRNPFARNGRWTSKT